VQSGLQPALHPNFRILKIKIKDRFSMADEKVRKEEFRVKGDAVVAKIKEILHEGNVRRITIKNEEGNTLIEIPLTLGVVGVLLLPVWAAIGAIAALVANLTIVVEKIEPVPDASADPEENSQSTE
jgi:hypothetical protein